MKNLEKKTGELNFGQLLHLLDNDLKNIIRNFEKQKRQIISAQYGIFFNQTYIYIDTCRFTRFEGRSQ